MDTLTLTPQMAVVLGLLGLTMVLFAFEILRIDVAAILVMLLLGFLSMIPGLDSIADPRHLFDGFASNAVISIIAVMIIGAGLDKTGVMNRVAAVILRIGGKAEQRLTTIIGGSVGIISSFMQNTGAVAVYIPVVSRISARTGLSSSRLLIPMSFCAILGGTVTLVGTSSTILLNDLIPGDMESFGLFEQTPIGLALLAAGILYFVVAGRFVLPRNETEGAKGEETTVYFRRVYGLSYEVQEMVVPVGSGLDGKQVSEVELDGQVRIIATHKGGELVVGPVRNQEISAGMDLAIMARKPEDLESFAGQFGLETRAQFEAFSEALAVTSGGVAEVVIPPNSDLIGKTCQEVWMRKAFGLSVLAIHRRGDTISRQVRTIPLEAGDTLVGYTAWDALARLEKNRNFVVVTSEYPHKELRPQKVGFAVFFFAVAIGLILFTDTRLSLAFLAGAFGMVLTGVLSMDEAYKAVSWKTVFLLASLIPLGDAVSSSGTAAWIAQQLLTILGDVPVWVLQAAVAVLGTFFALVMSNVGAVVLLVPLAIGIAVTAQAAGLPADPRVFALTVGIASSNSFLLPTHQCNALVMGPGGYRVKDFMRAGGIMTVIFLVVMLVMLNILF
jgi:di/tricarboxylate transporter